MGKVKKLNNGDQPIKSSIKDDQIVLQIPNKIKKEYERMFKENARLCELAKIVTFKKGKDKDDLTRVVLEQRRKLHAEDALELGATLEQLKGKATVEALKKEMEKKKKQKQPPIKLHFKFGREAIDQFRELHADKLKMARFKANLDGSADLYFDVSDCKNRMQFAARILAIADAISDIRQGRQHIRDMQQIKKAVEWLNEVASGVQQTHVEFVEMTGEELIKNGYSTPVNDDSILGKTLGFFVKLIKGQGNFRYLYFGKEVFPDRKYIVRLKTPHKLSKPIVANHEESVRLHYEFGEQQFAGAGLMMINQYSKEIIDAVNARLKKDQEK